MRDWLRANRGKNVYKLTILILVLAFVLGTVSYNILHNHYANAAGGSNGDGGGSGTEWAGIASDGVTAEISAHQEGVGGTRYRTTHYLFTFEFGANKDKYMSVIYELVSDSNSNGINVHTVHLFADMMMDNPDSPGNYRPPQTVEEMKTAFRRAENGYIDRWSVGDITDQDIKNFFAQEEPKFHYASIYSLIDIAPSDGAETKRLANFMLAGMDDIYNDYTCACGTHPASFHYQNAPHVTIGGPDWLPHTNLGNPPPPSMPGGIDHYVDMRNEIKRVFGTGFNGINNNAVDKQRRGQWASRYGYIYLEPYNNQPQIDFTISVDGNDSTNKEYVYPQEFYPDPPGDPGIPFTFDLKVTPSKDVIDGLSDNRIARIEWSVNPKNYMPAPPTPADELHPTIVPQVVDKVLWQRRYDYVLKAFDENDEPLGEVEHWVIVTVNEKDPPPIPTPDPPEPVENAQQFVIPKDWLTKGFNTKVPYQGDKPKAEVPEPPPEAHISGSHRYYCGETDCSGHTCSWSVDFERWTGPLTASYKASINPGGNLNNNTPTPHNGEYKNAVDKIVGLEESKSSTELTFNNIHYYWISHRYGAGSDNPTLAKYMAKTSEYGGTASEKDNSIIKPFLDRYGLTYDEKKRLPTKDSLLAGSFLNILTVNSPQGQRPFVTDTDSCAAGGTHGPLTGNAAASFNLNPLTEKLQVLVESRQLATAIAPASPVYSTTDNGDNIITYLASPVEPLKFYPTFQMNADITDGDPAVLKQDKFWVLGNKERIYTPIDWFEVRLEGDTPPLQFTDAPFSRDQVDRNWSAGNIPVLRAGYYFQVGTRNLKLIATSVVHVADQLYFEQDMSAWNAAQLAEHQRLVDQVAAPARSHVVTNMTGNYPATAGGTLLVPRIIRGFRAVQEIPDRQLRGKSYITYEPSEAVKTDIVTMEAGFIPSGRITRANMHRLTKDTPTRIPVTDPDIQKALQVNEAQTRLNAQLQIYNNAPTGEQFGGIMLVKQQTEITLPNLRTGRITTYINLSDAGGKTNSPAPYELRYFWGTGISPMAPMRLHGVNVPGEGIILSDPLRMAIRGTLYDDRGNQGQSTQP